MDKGKISVLMGIYNCADTLPRAVESIINQTYTNWELIICDDGSTDNSYDIAKSYAERDSRIILIQNEQNIRLAATLNHCLEYATGEYVSRMDGDDESVKDRFEKQVAYLRDHPNVDLVGTAVLRVIDDMKYVLHSVKNPTKYTLRHGPAFHHATILTYKYVYDRVGGYTVAERTKRAEDQDLWFKFYKEGFEGANLEEVYYIVYENIGSVKKRGFRNRWLTFQVQVKGFEMLDFPKHWLIKPFIGVLIRSLTPYWVQQQYRLLQHRKSDKKRK